MFGEGSPQEEGVFYNMIRVAKKIFDPKEQFRRSDKGSVGTSGSSFEGPSGTSREPGSFADAMPSVPDTQDVPDTTHDSHMDQSNQA